VRLCTTFNHSTSPSACNRALSPGFSLRLGHSTKPTYREVYKVKYLFSSRMLRRVIQVLTLFLLLMKVAWFMYEHWDAC